MDNPLHNPEPGSLTSTEDESESTQTTAVATDITSDSKEMQISVETNSENNDPSGRVSPSSIVNKEEDSSVSLRKLPGQERVPGKGARENVDELMSDGSASAFEG